AAGGARRPRRPRGGGGDPRLRSPARQRRPRRRRARHGRRQRPLPARQGGCLMRDRDDTGIAEGLAVRRAACGEELVQPNYAEAADFQRRAQDWTAGAVWADVWTGDGVDRRVRSLVPLGVLVALARPAEFESHLRGALAN